MINQLVKKVLATVVFLYAGSLCAAAEPIVRPQPLRPPTQKPGYVILLLGSSSVGKSRIRHTAIDFLRKLKGLPDITTVVMDDNEDRGISRQERKEFEGWNDEHIFLFQDVVKEAAQNKIVICDCILFESSDYDITENFVNKLKEQTNVISVLVYCTMGRLITNVVSRNHSGDELEGRRPISIVEQFADMYLSASPGSKPLDSITPEEFDDSIKQLRSLSADENGRRSTQSCFERLEHLRDSRTPSPIMWNPKLYQYTIKNDEKLDQRIATLCFDLYTKLTTLYH